MPEKPDEGDRDGSERNRQPADQQPDGQQGGQPPNQPQGGQPPNQPQGGQPPNQSQGGQPPNQSQGGQPPGQPQGRPTGQPQGRPRGGQGRSQAGQVGTNLDVDTDYLQEWAVYVTALFAASGFGLGVLKILINVVEEPLFEANLAGGLNIAGTGGALTPMIVTLSVAAVLLGAWFGRTLEGDDQESFVIAGGSVGAGAAVFFILVALTFSIGIDGVSVNLGGVIINLILTSVFVGAIAAGGAAVTRNLAPADL